MPLKKIKKSKIILVIEDEPMLMNMISFKLNKEGFTVLKAGNGQEGLKIATEKKPDLILLDLYMPLMDGEEMLKRLRKNKWGKEAKVIIATNFNDFSHYEKMKMLKVEGYLVKAENNPDQVLESIKKCLE